MRLGWAAYHGEGEEVREFSLVLQFVTGAFLECFFSCHFEPSSSLLKDMCEEGQNRSLPEQNAKWTIDLCMISISWILSGGGRSRYNIYRIHQVDPTTIAGTGEVCARKGRKTVFFNTRRSETVNQCGYRRYCNQVQSHL